MPQALAQHGSVLSDRSAPEARIGPNAILRVAEALAAHEKARVFEAAGLLHHLQRPPRDMVPDRDVATLYCALHTVLGTARALEIGATAGRLTARYLLDHRIPKLVQRLLPWLPRRAALAILMRAIGQHAWTFAGAGTFSYRLAPQPGFSIRGGPVARLVEAQEPVCSYYTATFETLLRAVVHPQASVTETACEATGDAACLYSIRL